MQNQTFQINTLHRGKYMLSFFSLLILSGIIASQIPSSEVVKIILILFMIPVILYLSVRWSKNPTKWTLTNEDLIVEFNDRSDRFRLENIDHIRSLTRSGGNLYVLYFNTRSPKRYWRNKLFSNDDDAMKFHHALEAHEIEYYKM